MKKENLRCKKGRGGDNKEKLLAYTIDARGLFVQLRLLVPRTCDQEEPHQPRDTGYHISPSPGFPRYTFTHKPQGRVNKWLGWELTAPREETEKI